MSDAPVADEQQPVYRYLPSPEEQLIPRNVPTAWMPLLGDFVVFSVDPVASVAHLDKVARQAAKKIRTHRHVGLIIMVRSCGSLMTAFHSNDAVDGGARNGRRSSQRVHLRVSQEGPTPVSPSAQLSGLMHTRFTEHLSSLGL